MPLKPEEALAWWATWLICKLFLTFSTSTWLTDISADISINTQLTFNQHSTDCLPIHISHILVNIWPTEGQYVAELWIECWSTYGWSCQSTLVVPVGDGFDKYQQILDMEVCRLSLFAVELQWLKTCQYLSNPSPTTRRDFLWITLSDLICICTFLYHLYIEKQWKKK